jgi:glucoamylase
MFFSEKRRKSIVKISLVVITLLPIVLLTIRYLRGPYLPTHVNGRAPDGNWTSSAWAPANNTMLGTSASISSNVWFTGYQGVISTVFYPSVDMPNSTVLQFLVGDRAHTWVDEEVNATEANTHLYDQRSLAWETTNTAKTSKAYQISKIIYTDPTRDALIQHVTFKALKGKLSDYLLYIYYDPTIHNSGDRNSSYTQKYAGRTMLVTTDASRDYVSALAASIPFQQDMTSSGFVHFNDGLTDLKGTSNCGSDHCPDYTMNYGYDNAPRGNTAQTGLLDLSNDNEINTSTQESISFDLVLAFGQNSGGNNAIVNAQKELSDTLTSLAQQASANKNAMPQQLSTYLAQWHSFDDSLKPAPGVGATPEIRQDRQQEYYLALNVLKASQDKKTGAIVKGLGRPWGATRGDDSSGFYHLSWARDLYHTASALLLAGDTTDAQRALEWLFTRQQQRDGHFPQNSYVTGEPRWTAIQMDQQAYPLMLAWKLNWTEKNNYAQYIKPAADYIVAHGPTSPQDRWEEPGGYSPATIAVEISGLICAANIAHINLDKESEKRYLETADSYQRNLLKWTYTTTGSLSKSGYIERVDDTGKPDEPSIISIANHGGSYDKRDLVDTSFLELVRQGVISADAPAIKSTLTVVDNTLKQAVNGHPYWFRYNHDNYGEHAEGYDFDGNGKGRLWPLLSGERGIYTIAAKQDPEPYLAAMMAAANSSGFIPEQIWDNSAPAGYLAGQATKSMNPLSWAMAEYVTLLFSASQQSIADVIPLTYDRYVLHPQDSKNVEDGKNTTPTETPTVTPTPGS